MLLRTALVLCCIPLACAVRAPSNDTRPVQYPEAWQQFRVELKPDWRTVEVFRLGAGMHRPAEYSLFELVDNGRVLRPLFRVTLRNSYCPWTSMLVGNGRFLVTTDDRWVDGQIEQCGVGRTDNCLVVYDLVGDRVQSWALRDIRDGVPNDAWWHRASFDPERCLLYMGDSSSPSDSSGAYEREFVVDLIAGAVQVQSCNRGTGGARLRAGGGSRVRWDWWNGSDGEPSWNADSVLPRFLRVSPPRPPLDDVMLDMVRVGGRAAAAGRAACRAP